MIKKRVHRVLVLFALAAFTACESASSEPREPIDVGTLAQEYEQSKVAVRSKYDGKEIIVRGYADAACMHTLSGDQGFVKLKERDRKFAHPVTCWFSREQAGEFTKVKGDQYLTVEGVFTGEAGADLKFCKLIKIE